jgi:tetratricopeptide (TPR) repeat protein
MEEKKIIPKHQVVTTKSLDFIIVGTIFLVFFLCPLFFTGMVAQNIGFEKIMLFYFLVLLGAVAWVTKAVVVGELNIKRTPLDWPIAGLLIIFITSTVLSISQKDSLLGTYGNQSRSLAAILIFVLFYYLVINNIDQKRIKLLFWGIIGSTSLITIFSLLQLFGKFILPIASTKGASFNPLGSLSGLTMYLVMTLPILVIGMAQLAEIHPGLTNKVVKIATKVFLGVMILLSLLVLTLLNGFTFWPAAIVGIVIVLMFLLSKIIKISNSNIVIPIATFLLLIILLVLGNFNIMSLNLPVEVSLSRQISFNIAKASLKDNPLLGSGPSTFYYSFDKYKSADFNASPLWSTKFNNASGYLFETAATVGSLGVLAIIIIALVALSICFLTLIKVQKNDTQSILLSLFSSFIMVIIFGLLFSIDNSLVLISTLISILAVSMAIVNYPEKFKTLNLSFRASPKYALALAAIFLSLSAGVVILFTMGLKMYLADFYVMQSVNASDINQKIEKINKAITLAPYQDIYYINLANYYMALANQEATGAKNQTIIENSLASAIDMGKKALALSPNSTSNTESMALIYENASFYVQGALEWAENLYNKSIELSPDSPMPYLRMALINMARANAEKDKTQQEYYINEAIKKYDLALAKKSDLSAANYGKGIAYEKLNNIEGAIEELKKAVISTNDNIDYRFELGRLYFNRGAANPGIAQTAPENITEGSEANQDLSVSGQTGGTIKKNDDIATAEQLFLSILQANPNHANALYSLAMIYQKTGETDNAKAVVKQLLTVVASDQASVDIVKKQFSGLY